MTGWRARYGAGLYAVVFALACLLGAFGPLALALLASVAAAFAAPLWTRGGRWPVALLPLVALSVWASVSMAWSPRLAELRAEGFAFEAFTAAKLWGMLLLYGLLVVGALSLSCGLLDTFRSSRRRPGPRTPDAASPHEAAAAEQFSSDTVYLGPGFRRDEREGGLALWALSIAACVWAAILFGDGLSSGVVWSFFAGLFGAAPTEQFREKKAAEGAYVLAVLAWPAVAFLWTRAPRALALLIPVGLAAAAAGLSAWAAAAALAAGALAWLVVARAGRLGAVALGTVLAAKTLLAPWSLLLLSRAGALEAVGPHLLPSFAHRLRIWTFAVERIAEKPFLGWGLDASRKFDLNVPLHPHDAALQLWLELGAVGALIAAAFWYLLFRGLGRLALRDRHAAAVAAASATAYFTVGALSFGVWQEWWLAVGALAACAAILYAGLRPSGADERERNALQNL